MNLTRTPHRCQEKCGNLTAPALDAATQGATGRHGTLPNVTGPDTTSSRSRGNASSCRARRQQRKEKCGNHCGVVPATDDTGVREIRRRRTSRSITLADPTRNVRSSTLHTVKKNGRAQRTLPEEQYFTSRNVTSRNVTGRYVNGITFELLP